MQRCLVRDATGERQRCNGPCSVARSGDGNLNWNISYLVGGAEELQRPALPFA